MVFLYKDQWLVSSKGSFYSEQALWARELFDKSKDIKRVLYTEKMNYIESYTHCFERLNTKERDVAIVFDIDGTLAHLNGRSPYDMKRVGEDLTDEPMMSLLMMIEDYVGSGTEIFFCSGREDVSIKDTREWFCKQIRALGSIPESNYLFRKNGDKRVDFEVKEEMWDEIENTHNILCMFDDRLQVVRRARMLGFKVLNVEHNNF